MDALSRRLRSQLRVATLIGLTTAVSVSASGQAVGPEIPIWTDAGVNSSRPSVAFNIVHEEFLVVWQNVQGPNTRDVYARRVNMDGSLSTWFSVVSSVNETHWNPDVAFNHLRDEYLVAWHYEYAMDDLDILGSLVSWNGSSIGTPFPVASAVDSQMSPEVVFNPSVDEYLVVYENKWAGGLWDIDAQRVDGDGSLLSWANIASDSATLRFSPRAAFSPELGRYIMVYMHQPLSTGGIAVACKTAPSDLAGVSIGFEYAIALDPATSAYNPAVAGSPEGFVSLFSFDADITARRVAPDGNPLGSVNGYAVGHQTAVGPVVLPSRAHGVDRADAVGAVAAWQEYDGLFGWDVYAQAISPFSDRVLSDTFTVAASAADEGDVDIACAPWGVCLVVYGKDSDIAGKIVRMGVFADGFESGDTSAWPVVIP